MPAIFTQRYDHTRSAGERYVTEEFDIKYTRRGWGGYNVTRRDNGRILGWVFRTSDGLWNAYVASGAFRGEDIGDEGDVLDTVPLYLFNGEHSLKSRPVDYSNHRDDAASAILTWLHRYEAPALGYGRHAAVTPSRFTH